jgi:hypothetical protein
LWALSQIHEEAAVDGLLAKLTATAAPALRNKLLTTLARLYQKEAPHACLIKGAGGLHS